jgi:hypothetical protein
MGSMTRKPGAFLFASGFAVLVIALTATVILAARGFLLVGALPVLIMVGGVALLARGLSARGRRAAGQGCAQCSRKIIFEHEAEFCAVCDKPLHAKCAAEHAARAHRPESTGPFR